MDRFAEQLNHHARQRYQPDADEQQPVPRIRDEGINDGCVCAGDQQENGHMIETIEPHALLRRDLDAVKEGAGRIQHHHTQAIELRGMIRREGSLQVRRMNGIRPMKAAKAPTRWVSILIGSKK